MRYSPGRCATNLHNIDNPPEPTMFLHHAAPSPFATIALWTAPQQRALAALTALARRLQASATRASQQRAARREARRHHAIVSSLDAHTLRDIGLGDWAVSTRDADDAVLRRTLDLRGF
jgi:hypothetical protein